MPAIAHQNKILGNTSGGGSTILVTTSESTLYGQTVTLSDGTTTLTGTFSNAGECEFTGVMMVGTLTATSGTASTSINVPYFGVYSMTLSFFSATITATFPSGATCTCVGNGETYTASTSPHTFTVHGAATYRVTATIDGQSKYEDVVISTDGQTASITIEYGTINVTYDNAFRGTSITCVQGGTTITKTAPSGANTMTFYPPTTGSWVISGTVGGTPYSKTANVTSLSTSVSVSLETVPDGKTATPTDDISMWLACGQITGKSYTTLSQVLDDAETYERLLSDSNACDYMKRSTTWAIAEGQVPVMTSDTAPSGECICSSNGSGNEAYKAFDGNDSTYWNASTADTSTGKWIGYKFDTAKAIYSLLHRSSAGATQTVKVQYSDDNSTWTDTGTTYTITGTDGKKRVSIGDNGSHLYWRVYLTATTGATSFATEVLQFYESDITNSQDAMMRLGKYDYACDALLADSTWVSAIANSTYFEYVLNVVNPIMTGDTTPSGAVIKSSQATSYNAYYAFNGANATNGSDGANGACWVPTTSATDNYIGYQFSTATIINKVKMRLGKYKWSARTFTVQGSNDGSDWDDLATISFEANSVTSITYDYYEVAFTNDTAYSYYRVFCAEVIHIAGQQAYLFDDIRFYGRHTAQTDIIVTAHGGDTVYYMENGSPVPLTTADRDTGIGTVDWSDLPKGAITLYSSTAKNPSDLTADYSKTVYVTEYTTQIYLMPDNALYWYGSKTNAFQECNSTNGWSVYGTAVSPTYNTLDMAVSPASGTSCFIGYPDALDDVTFYCIGKCTSSQVRIISYATKTVYTAQGPTDSTIITSATKAKYSLSVSSPSYISVGELNANGVGSFDAVWYE